MKVLRFTHKRPFCFAKTARSSGSLAEPPRFGDASDLERTTDQRRKTFAGSPARTQIAVPNR